MAGALRKTVGAPHSPPMQGAIEKASRVERVTFTEDGEDCRLGLRVQPVPFIGHSCTESTRVRLGPPRMRAVSLDSTGEEAQKRVALDAPSVATKKSRERKDFMRRDRVLDACGRVFMGRIC